MVINEPQIYTVYALLRQGVVVYVGQTGRTMRERMVGHNMRNKWRKDFDDVQVLATCETREEALALERKYIRIHDGLFLLNTVKYMPLPPRRRPRPAKTQRERPKRPVPAMNSPKAVHLLAAMADQPYSRCGRSGGHTTEVLAEVTCRACSKWSRPVMDDSR